ncbi:GH92 family glycosyl hydrolase [Marinilabiliaceae bacterium ANBcel2]|nr:GH92 family glycosyl hydrolase [Marinilabiliaceae bacterium ANBcel2]
MKRNCVVKNLVLLLIGFLVSSCSSTKVFADKPAEFVDPFIGTSNYGATFPGSVMPWGMVSIVPFNVLPYEGNEYSNTDDWCSNPYVYNNEIMSGFTHVNLSGVGCPDLGSIILMPTTGELEVDYSEYGTTLSDEMANPGYYSAYLDRYGVGAEATATMRTGRSRYTFPEGKSNILLDLGQGLTNETGAYVKMVSDTQIEGYKLLGTFCYNPEAVFPVYFVVEFDRPADERGYWKEHRRLGGHRHNWSETSGEFKIYDRYSREMAGENIGAWYSFDTEEGEEIEVKVGVSYVSIENARENLSVEQDGLDFEQIAQNAFDKWNEELSRIEVEGGTDDDKQMFYTALYHLLIHPNVIQDVNGEYPAMESNEIATVDGRDRYTVFSLWDTYRTVHPFLTMVYPEKQIEMINSMLDMYNESGWLPKWELYSRETDVMNGDPALIVIGDTYMRGLRDFDIDLAFEAMMKSATTQGAKNRIRPDNDFYSENYYVPFIEAYDNSVAQALEYYVADYSLSRFVRELGYEEEADIFYERSLGYKRYFDPEYGLMRPVKEDGIFMEGFDPVMGEGYEEVHGFHEGSSWQYSFSIPHDIEGLAGLFETEEAFVDQLDRAFSEDLLDMGNQPNMGYPYFFSFIEGEEWRTQKNVRDLIRKYYGVGPAGLPGNDDTGTMSAWLMYGMMGIYPVTPGDPSYALTSPVFDKVTIHLDKRYYSNDKLVIESNNGGEENIFIESIELNGEKVDGYFIDHLDLIEAGTLRFNLSSEPKK